MPHGVWVKPSLTRVRPWFLRPLADWKRLQERARRDGLVSVDNLPLLVDALDNIDILACSEEHPLIGERMDCDEIRAHGRGVLARFLDRDVTHLVLGAHEAVGAVEFVHDPCEGLGARHIKIQHSIFGWERVDESRMVSKPQAQLLDAGWQIAGPEQVNARTIAVGEGRADAISRRPASAC